MDVKYAQGLKDLCQIFQIQRHEIPSNFPRFCSGRIGLLIRGSKAEEKWKQLWDLGDFKCCTITHSKAGPHNPLKSIKSFHQLSGSRYSLSHNIGSKQISQTYEHQSFRRGRRLGRVKINGEVREVKIFPPTKIFWRKSFKKINFSGKMRPPGKRQGEILSWK